MQADLAIASLGHRKGLLRAIQDLRQHSAAQAADRACNESDSASPSASSGSQGPHHAQVWLHGRSPAVASSLLAPLHLSAGL